MSVRPEAPRRRPNLWISQQPSHRTAEMSGGVDRSPSVEVVIDRSEDIEWAERADAGIAQFR
jgi:hypothetical protein